MTVSLGLAFLLDSFSTVERNTTDPRFYSQVTSTNDLKERLKKERILSLSCDDGLIFSNYQISRQFGNSAMYLSVNFDQVSFFMKLPAFGG